MSLNKEQKAELRKLFLTCLQEDGTPDPKAKSKDLERYEELIALAQDERPAEVPKLRGHKLSPKAQELKERGAKYIGAENVNFGTDEKPRYVVREYFTDKDTDGAPMAIMIQNDKEIQIGRLFDKRLFKRITA